jgi:hypothetical protein
MWIVAVSVTCALFASGCVSDTSGARGGNGTAWINSLGAGIVVTPPGPGIIGVGPGKLSPPDVVALWAEQARSQDPGNGDLCDDIEPPAQNACDGLSAAQVDPQLDANQQQSGTYSDGYIATNGDEALVGVTGEYCLPLKKTCATNTNPSAVFSSRKSFTTLFSEALTAMNPNDIAYTLIPCVEQYGDWFIDIPTSDFSVSVPID